MERKEEGNVERKDRWRRKKVVIEKKEMEEKG
jgi:hypothetical protein